MAVLRELFPLVAFLALAAFDLFARLAFGKTSLWLFVAFWVNLPFSPLVVLSGFGWMGRRHKWVGGLVLLLRAALSFVVFGASAGAVLGGNYSREYATVLWFLLAGWIAMPIVSACIVAIVPANKSAIAQAANR